MGTKRNVDMSTSEKEVKIVDSPDDSEKKTTQVKAKPTRVRSKKYQLVRSQVDKTKTYDPFAALELAKRLSYSKFAGSIEAHGVVSETGISAKVTFPHTTGQSVKVAIASDELLKEIEAGNFNFDVLVATPDFMSKLTKHARTLGPKGLMPNPKNGTITDKPEAKKKELEAGSVIIKTEKKAPLIHIVIGKTDMETKDLVENLQALTKAFKGKLQKLSISASMGPGIKVEIS